MAALEQVIQMKNQGYSDQDVINELSQQGVSPREINDALKQAQIKNAVSGTDQGMQPSMMEGGEEIPAPSANQYQPATQEQTYAPAPEQAYAPQEQQQQYYAPEAAVGGYAPGIDTDTVMEIADQIFSDKIKKVQTQMDATSQAAILLQTKFDNLSERLKKIETIIDKLQISILEKIGSYGQNLENIKDEMSMMQDSFSKMVSPRDQIRQQSQQRYPEESVQETEAQPKKQISGKK